MTTTVAKSGSPKKPGWQIHRLRYKTYVAARSIADFYKLKYTVNGNAFTMSRENLVIEGKTDSPVIRMNGIQFRLSSPPTTNEFGILIDKSDLVTLFSPLLAPDTRSWQDGVDGVLVDLLPVHALAGNKGAAEAKRFRQQLREALQSTFEELKIPVRFLGGEEAASPLSAVHASRLPAPDPSLHPDISEETIPPPGLEMPAPASVPPATPEPPASPKAAPVSAASMAPLPASVTLPAFVPAPAPGPAPLPVQGADAAPAPSAAAPVTSAPVLTPIPVPAPSVPAVEESPAPPPVTPAPAPPVQREPVPPPFKSPVHLVVKLRSDAKKPELRTVLLAPPGAAQSKDKLSEAERRVFLGNLRDSENLALATQIHAQLGRDVVFQRGNRGIDREGEESLRAADAPAVLMEFAIGQKGLSSLSVAGRPQRLAAAIARGVQRFDSVSQALSDRRAANPPKVPAPPSPPVAPVKKEAAQKGKGKPPASKTKSTATVAAAAPTGPVLRFKSSSALSSALITDNFSFDFGVRLAVEAIGKAKIDPAKVELQVFSFDVVKGGELTLIAAEPPRFLWKSNEPNWLDKNLELVDVLYRYFKTALPPVKPTETPRESAKTKSAPTKKGAKDKGVTAAKEEKAKPVPVDTAPSSRVTYGYVARLLYEGRFQDEIASPGTLRTHLSRFAAIAP